MKRPSGAPGPLKKLPVFANQVPFRFDPATDAWTEVVLPAVAPTDGGARKKPGSRPPVPPQPAAASTSTTRPSPDHEAEAEADAETETTSVVEEVGGGRTYKLCTMNVLFDLYGNERIQTKRRMPALIDLLRDTGADIIGLQEVTQPFLIRLMREEWVQRNYYVSDGSLGYSLKPYYGQLILSKLPFHRLITHQFSKSKKVTIAQFLVEGRKVWVPVVHLTSNRKGSDLYNKRHLQLQVIFAKICPAAEPEDEKADVWMMGDFNFEDGEEDRGLPPQWSQFVDVWPSLYPTQAGYTFDPQRNAMAAETTSSGRSRRIDRVMLRSGAGAPRWEARSMELIGTQPLPPVGDEGGDEGGAVVFPSDHFGLVAVIGSAGAATTSNGVGGFGSTDSTC